MNNNYFSDNFEAPPTIISNVKVPKIESGYKHKSVGHTVLVCVSMFLFMCSSIIYIVFDKINFGDYVQHLVSNDKLFILQKIFLNLLNLAPFIFGVAAIICLMALIIPQLYCKDATFVFSLCAWVVLIVGFWLLFIERMPIVIYITTLTVVLTNIVSMVYSICIRCDMLNEQSGKSFKAETALVCFVPVYNIYWSYKKGKQIYNASKINSIATADNSIGYLLLTAFGLGLISYFLMTSQINDIYKKLS